MAGRFVTGGVLTWALLTGSVAIAAPCKVIIFVHPGGTVEFNGELLKDQSALDAKFATYKKRANCEMHIKTGPNVRFEALGRVILAAQKAGYSKVGFITEPQPRSNR